MILRLCLNQMVLQSSEHELSLRQRQPDGPGRILINRRAAANLVNADGPIRPGHLHHDPPLHPVPRLPDQADRSTPRFWTVSVQLTVQSKGFTETWIGYKLHIDTADGEIPISCVLTAASVHDSQVAIPLATITAGRVTNLYDLMDSTYDVAAIKQHSRDLNHVPIIDINPRATPGLKRELAE